MKEDTLYEILEVSEKASDEVIEKAYKVLVKKYHPDLQAETKREDAEKKMKQINEAYDILSNPSKRNEYDVQLEQKRKQKERISTNQNNYGYNNLKNENKENLKTNKNIENTDKFYDKIRLEYEKKLKKEEELKRMQMQEKLNKEYENAYYDYLKSLGYKIKYKWTKENIKDILIVILIMISLITIMWFIPPTHDWMVNFYEQNPIIKIIIDIVLEIVKSIFTGIWNFITSIFK